MDRSGNCRRGRNRWATGLVAGTWAIWLSADIGRHVCSQVPVELQDEVRVAIERAVPLIERSAKGHTDQRSCFSCHNQALPIMALTAARQAGIAETEAAVGQQVEFTYQVLARWAERTPNRDTFGGGQADTAGYALFALRWGGKPADDVTSAVVEYLLQRDAELGHWRNVSQRPPSEASPFTTTALALAALAAYGTESQAERIAIRRQTAQRWLLDTDAKETEDRVFRLWGLHYSGAEPTAIEQAVAQLLELQRDSGGWGQTESMEADAYATGTALVALHLAGRFPTTGRQYVDGLRFLLRTQAPDGSWHVRSRSRPFQTYFETGFPYGPDQWISLSATCWAATALALAVENTQQ